MGDQQKPWEPDPSRVGKNWTDMFEPSKPFTARTAPPPPPDPEYDDAPVAGRETGDYKPWTLQRGAGRPSIMIDFRRYEPKSGLWMGKQLSYAHLLAVEYVGDRMVSLDFGTRSVVIEGRGLDELARHLQQCSVTIVHEHAPRLWAVAPDGAIVSTIRDIG